MYYSLTPELETGNLTLDWKHKGLMYNIEMLMQDITDSHKPERETVESSMSSLISYLTRLFGHEEFLQKSSNYPEKFSHQEAHEGFMQEMNALKKKFQQDGLTEENNNTLIQLVNSIVHHIKFEDRKFNEHIRVR